MNTSMSHHDSRYVKKYLKNIFFRWIISNIYHFPEHTFQTIAILTINKKLCRTIHTMNNVIPSEQTPREIKFDFHINNPLEFM